MNSTLYCFICCFMLLPYNSYCQNWEPVKINQKTNFRVSPTPYSLDGNENPLMTLSYTNQGGTIYKVSPWTYTMYDTLYLDQSTFLGDYLNTSNGIYLFTMGTYGFEIHPNTNLNDSWSYDTNNNIATVTSLYQDTIFGVVDSFKTISISTGDSIILSKDHGIFYFSTNGKEYNLIGIETSFAVHVGRRVPNTHDIFNFELGDVFVYRYSYSGGGYPITTIKQFTKYEVIDKQVVSDGYEYSLKVDEWRNYIEQGNGPTSGINDTTVKVRVTDSTWIYLTSDNNDIYADYDMGKDPLSGSPDGRIITVTVDSNGLYRKSFYDYGVVSSLGGGRFIYYDKGVRLMTYVEGLGSLFNNSTSYMQEKSRTLIGYIKNGQVYGDTAVLSKGLPSNYINVDKLEGNSVLDINIYPQPADGFIVVEDNANKLSNLKIELTDTQGKQIKNWDINSFRTLFRLDVKEIPKGIYVLKLRSDEKTFVQKLIIYRDE